MCELLALGGVYLFFGLTGPLGARCLSQIMGRLGGRIRVTVPPPVPADGVTQYVSNASQIGMLGRFHNAAARSTRRSSATRRRKRQTRRQWATAEEEG